MPTPELDITEPLPARKPKRIRSEREKIRANELRKARRAGPKGEEMRAKRRAYCQKMKGLGLLWHPEITPEKRIQSAAYQRERRAKDPTTVRSKEKEWRTKNKEKLKAQARARWAKNREAYAERRKKYAKPTKEERNKYARAYYGNRRKTDPIYKMVAYLRSRTYLAVKLQRGKKSQKSTEFLGCSIPQLRAHLEAQFTEGMTWQNHGMRGWHIDHIRPCASFDLADPDSQRACFHYTNLQPLWWSDNLAKSCRLDWAA